nr:hypothetical protein CFP56_31859 [Quercus suber]
MYEIILPPRKYLRRLHHVAPSFSHHHLYYSLSHHLLCSLAFFPTNTPSLSLFLLRVLRYIEKLQKDVF